jgi:cation-transporting ATPase 13A3/4/5
LPIRKFPLREGLPNETFDPQQAGKNNSLFAGTTIKQANEHARALVLKTRTNTDKGKLIQRILFPQPISFIFNEQLKVVFCILLVWAVILLALGSWWLGGSGMTAWFYGMTCAAQVMNPLLPGIERNG